MSHTHAVVLAFAAAAALAGCRTGSAVTAAPLGAPPRVVSAATESASPGTALDRAVCAARVVCLGELHAQRPVQQFERDVLAKMASCGGKLLVGMEMFKRPFQQPLDDYVAGRIDEREMLRRTEWFTRWGRDHTMYAPIWRFAREHGIRVVALNVEDSISSKIGRQGLASLTAEERAGVAADVDLGNVLHRRRIMAVFEGGVHPMPAAMLDSYYEAMTAWDETMAESAARALEGAGPGARMLIVAGRGHIEEYTGLPARLAKRVPGLRTLNVVCALAQPADPAGGSQGPSAEEEEDDDDDRAAVHLGDFVVEIPGAGPGQAPRLGAQFKDGSLVVEKVVPGGNAERMGLEPGDELTRISGPDGRLVAIQDAVDLRYELSEMWARGGTRGLVTWRRGGAEFAAKSFELIDTPDPPLGAPAPAKP